MSRAPSGLRLAACGRSPRPEKSWLVEGVRWLPGAKSAISERLDGVPWIQTREHEPFWGGLRREPGNDSCSPSASPSGGASRLFSDRPLRPIRRRVRTVMLRHSLSEPFLGLLGCLESRRERVRIHCCGCPLTGDRTTASPTDRCYEVMNIGYAVHKCELRSR